MSSHSHLAAQLLHLFLSLKRIHHAAAKVQVLCDVQQDVSRRQVQRALHLLPAEDAMQKHVQRQQVRSSLGTRGFCVHSFGLMTCCGCPSV